MLSEAFIQVDITDLVLDGNTHQLGLCGNHRIGSLKWRPCNESLHNELFQRNITVVIHGNPLGYQFISGLVGIIKSQIRCLKNLFLLRDSQ